jgi:GNAT superfamily N-acetyltransferase
MYTDPPFIVAAPAHPSLDGAIVRFCDALRAETRWSAQRSSSRTSSPSLARRLAAGTPGLRLAAVHDGEIVGVARIDSMATCGPELLIAVAAAWRGRGIARSLGQDIVARAHAAGVERIVLHTDRRHGELRDLGAALGFQVVDLDRGRIDLLRTLQPVSRSA